jgi:hypothetical protein
MKIFLLFIIALTLVAAETPVYEVGPAFTGRFVAEDGSELNDRYLDQCVHNGVVWSRIYHLGKLFWARNDETGNVLLTWDWVDYLGEGVDPDEFVLVYRKPVLGQEWNPDGVTIRVDAVGESVIIKGKTMLCDRYAFLGEDGEVAVTTWVSPGLGVVKMDRKVYGTMHSYERVMDDQ